MSKLSWYRAGMGIAVLVIVATAPRAQAAPAAGAELQNRTTQAFDRYVRLTEARLSGSGPFLWIDGLPDAKRREALEAVRRKELSIERLETRDNGREIDVPGGMIHHWVGTAFVPSATIDDALALLQNYDAHQRIYAPTVAASKLQSRDGDRFRFFLRFVMKKVITVVVNSEHEAHLPPAGPRSRGRMDPQHAHRRSRERRTAHRAREAGRQRRRIPLAAEHLLAAAGA